MPFRSCVGSRNSARATACLIETEFLPTVCMNSVNAQLLLRLRSLDLPECHLPAGRLFQTMWNRSCGRDMQWG